MNGLRGFNKQSIRSSLTFNHTILSSSVQDRKETTGFNTEYVSEVSCLLFNLSAMTILVIDLHLFI